MWKFLRCISKYLSEGVIKVFMTVLYRALSARANKIETKRIRLFPQKLPTVQNSWTTWQKTICSPKLFLTASMMAKTRWRLSQMFNAIKMLLKQFRISFLRKGKVKNYYFWRLLKMKTLHLEGCTHDAIDATLSLSFLVTVHHGFDFFVERKNSTLAIWQLSFCNTASPDYW